MGKLIYGMLCSLDGYIAGPEGGPRLPVPEPDLHRHFNRVMDDAAIALYGRRMYEVMRYWDEDQSGNPEVARDFAAIWQKTPKLVVSTTLRELGPNAQLLSGELGSAVRALKAGTAGEIHVSGAELAGSLSRLGLIGEYRLYVQPVVTGGGKPFFAAGTALALDPLGTETLPQGVVLLRYRPAAAG